MSDWPLNHDRRNGVSEDNGQQNHFPKQRLHTSPILQADLYHIPNIRNVRQRRVRKSLFLPGLSDFSLSGNPGDPNDHAKSPYNRYPAYLRVYKHQFL